MSKRTKKSASPQSAKPYPDYPLTAHPSGRWCKKIKGKLHYFGRLSDPMTALTTYLDQKDDLFAGRVPRAKLEAGPKLRDLCNQFLTSKKDKLDRGELSPRSFYDLHEAAERLIKQFGRDRLLTDIRPDDFATFQRTFPKTWGPIRRGREIQCVRSIFNYAMSQGLIQTIVRFGDFKKPAKSVLRKHRAKAKTTNGLKMFEADEVRKILDAATVPVRAMVLLALNCGLGPTDLANLTFSVLDLDGAWLDFPRPKTGIDRRCPLWTETVAAVKGAIERRPKPKEEADAGLVFITKYGGPWVHFRLEEQERDKGDQADAKKAKKQYRLDFDNAVSKEFDKLLRELGLKRPGRSIYALRHTLETIGSEARDQPALDTIMGHADDSMAATYRERVADERLQRVAEHVRSWLFAKDAGPEILPMTNAAQ